GRLCPAPGGAHGCRVITDPGAAPRTPAARRAGPARQDRNDRDPRVRAIDSRPLGRTAAGAALCRGRNSRTHLVHRRRDRCWAGRRAPGPLVRRSHRKAHPGLTCGKVDQDEKTAQPGRAAPFCRARSAARRPGTEPAYLKTDLEPSACQVKTSNLKDLRSPCLFHAMSPIGVLTELLCSHAATLAGSSLPAPLMPAAMASTAE